MIRMTVTEHVVNLTLQRAAGSLYTNLILRISRTIVIGQSISNRRASTIHFAGPRFG